MTENRYDFIDIAKGFGILSVVWAHILLVGNSHRIIYAFHMPLFFFLSGFLFDEHKYPSFNNFIKKRFKRLIIPYLIYSIVTWGIWAIFRYVRGDEVRSYLMPLLQTVIAQGSGAYLVHNSALWFIPCLLVVEIMFFFILKIRHKMAIVVCFGVACLGIVLAHCYGRAYLDNMPWNLDAAFLALPFYSVGNVLRKAYRFYSNENQTHYFIRIIIAIVLSSITVFLSFCFGECSMGSSSYQCHEFIFISRAFMGIVALMEIAMLLSKIQLIGMSTFLDALRWCGRYSLEIMCIHIPIKGIVVIMITKLLKLKFDLSESFLYSLISFIITIGISLFVIIFIINKLKYIFNKLFLEYMALGRS